MPHLKVFYINEEYPSKIRLIQTQYVPPRVDQDVVSYGNGITKEAKRLFDHHSEITFLTVKVYFTKKIGDRDRPQVEM
jgi:hypothetical protein